MKQERIWIADQLMEAAEAATGLGDWGEEELHRPLEVLCHSLNHEAHLHAAGTEMMRGRLIGAMVNRLQVMDYRKRDAAVAAQQIRRPLIVLGLPRSGTSHMHALLAADPRTRAPRVWEMAVSVPPPRQETYEQDPRIQMIGDAMAASGLLTDELMSIHPFSFNAPEECGQILEHTGYGAMYSAMCWAPTFANWRENVDFRPAMRYHRQTLQHLQAHCPGAWWVLKSAEYHYHIEELLAVYPDACIVMTHRDPVKTLPSEVSLYRAMRRLTTEGHQFTAQDAGKAVLQGNALAVERFMDLRRRLGHDSRFIDVHYADLVRSPMGVAERVYGHFDLPLTDSVRAAMHQYLCTHRQNRHGVHRYTLDEWGYSAAEIDRHFGDYIAYFNIPLERTAA